MMSFLQKAFKRIVSSTVPYNSRFKPAGIHHRIGQKDVNFKLIHPSYQSVLNIPVQLYESSTDYIKLPNVVDVPPAYVVEAEKARIYASRKYIAVIDRNNLLIPEVSYHFVHINKFGHAADHPVLTNRFFIKPQCCKGTVFTMLSGGGAKNNYGHWLIDAIPRVGLLKRSGLFEEVDWFLVPNYKYDYQKDSLTLLGIPREKIIEANDINHIQADRVIATTTPRHIGHIPEWVGSFLRENYLNVIKPKSYPPLVYIRRSDSSIRNIINEEELVTALSRLGFVDYELSRFSFAEKVNLFRSAEMIVAATGAGLANLVFCTEGTKGLEIFNSSFVSTMFADIAAKTGIDYSFMITPADKMAKNIKQAEYGHFAVDIALVTRRVENILVPAGSQTSSANKTAL